MEIKNNNKKQAINLQQKVKTNRSIGIKNNIKSNINNIKIKPKQNHNQKGILLTLLMLIFLILILTEVIVYTMINMNYNNSMENFAVAQNEGTIISTAKQVISSTLQESLSKAYSIILTNSSSYNIIRGSLSTNLASLMENGTINNENFNTIMNSAMLNNINNTLNTGLAIKDTKIKVENARLFIYQTSPSMINATYSGIIKIQSGSQNFNYSFIENASININNTVDLSTAQRSNPSYIKMLKMPKAVIIGNTLASSGSLSQYLFTYGTIINISGSPSCSGIPSVYQNSKFILATPNSINLQQNVCNMGGLITYTPILITPTAPYLAYAPSSNILEYIKNGTQVLIYGNALELINASPIINYINNNYYFSSAYLPDYLNSLSNNTNNERNGLASFSSFYTTTPYFSDVNLISNIITSNNVVLPQQYTISFWINKNNNMSSCDSILAGSPTLDIPFEIYAPTNLGCSAGSSDGTPLTFKYVTSTGTTMDGLTSTPIQSNIWTYAAVVFSQNTLTWYINGNRASIYPDLVAPSLSSNRIWIGYNGISSFNGSIADIQIYNTPLPSAAIAELYREGISGKPIVSSNIILWMPLEGNANDYSSTNNNGIAQNVFYKRLRGYFADPFYSSFNNNVTLAPLLNCLNMSMCYNSSIPHIYFRNTALAINNTNNSEQDSLGLINVIIPKAIDFFGNSYINESNSISWMASNKQPYSFSLWIDPINSNGIIIDEFNSALHDSFLSLINGNVVVGYYNASGEVCSNLGAVPMDKLSNVAFTYSGTNTLYGYINTVQTFQSNSLDQRIAPSAPLYYMLGFYNIGTTYNCGTLSNFKGMIADYQIYNTQLSQLQLQELYANNFIPSLPPQLWMPLSGPAGQQQSRLINTTKELENNNYGMFELNGKHCSVASILNDSCGINYIP
ncbi:MAG: LamG domain-containing protein, partial [Candidatus Marsarchaeota archaeon]|nr:LamG domain-containing protein [Candidatus Marsarchaeota archaeon]